MGAQKFYVALSGFLVVLAKDVADGKLTGTELSELIIALATALTVYVWPNKNKGSDNSGRQAL
jgi:hypothetical protein